MYNKVTLIGKVVTPPSRVGERVNFLLLTNHNKTKVRHNILTLGKLAEYTIRYIKYGNIVLAEGALDYIVKNGNTSAYIVAYSITQILNYHSDKPIIKVSMVDTKGVIDYDYPSILQNFKVSKSV